MLYDTRWDRQTKTNPFSLENLIAWLEKRPANEHYNPYDPEHCLFGQFVKSQRSWFQWLGGPLFVMRKSQHLWRQWHEIALSWPQNGMTFGGALERARNHLLNN